jgi:hypothetical protein
MAAAVMQLAAGRAPSVWGSHGFTATSVLISAGGQRAMPQAFIRSGDLYLWYLPRPSCNLLVAKIIPRHMQLYPLCGYFQAEITNPKQWSLVWVEVALIGDISWLLIHQGVCFSHRHSVKVAITNTYCVFHH